MDKLSVYIILAVLVTVMFVVVIWIKKRGNNSMKIKAPFIQAEISQKDTKEITQTQNEGENNTQEAVTGISAISQTQNGGKKNSQKVK